MSFALRLERPRRRPSLTPMIDVVFILLIFFMLASRLGQEQAIGMELTGSGSYVGPPRLVEVFPGGLAVNGLASSQQEMLAALVGLGGLDGIVVIRAREGAGLQRVVDVMTELREAGMTRFALIE